MKIYIFDLESPAIFVWIKRKRVADANLFPILFPLWLPWRTASGCSIAFEWKLGWMPNSER